MFFKPQGPYHRLDDIADMASVPVVSLANAPDDDVVRVVGVVERADPLLVAPFSLRPCVYYEVEVHVGHDLKALQAISDACAFRLLDGATRAYVQPPCPIVILADRLEEIGRGDQLPAPVDRWLRENHAADEDWWGAKRVTWTERRIEPGDRLAVVGLSRLEDDDGGSAGGYRDAPTMLVVFETDEERAPLSLSDHPTLITAA